MYPNTPPNTTSERRDPQSGPPTPSLHHRRGPPPEGVEHDLDVDDQRLLHAEHQRAGQHSAERRTFERTEEPVRREVLAMVQSWQGRNGNVGGRKAAGKEVV